MRRATKRYCFVRGSSFLQSGGNPASLKSNFGAIFDKDRTLKDTFIKLESNNQWDRIYDLILPTVRNRVGQQQLPQ
jgi:hypothetical protein